MEGQRRGDNSWFKRRRASRTQNDEDKPLCFPHKWTWSPYERKNRAMHERYQYCSKCHVEKRGSRDISRHDFRRGVCTKCGELGMKGKDFA